MNTLPSNFARMAVLLIFILNITCAFDFLLRPDLYSGSFEVSGVPGRVIVQSLGILFLMWNATYPPVIWNPKSQQTLFAVVLVQQLVGVIGESWLYMGLPSGHAALATTGLRFIIFDGLGLLLMGAAYAWLFLSAKLK